MASPTAAVDGSLRRTRRRHHLHPHRQGSAAGRDHRSIADHHPAQDHLRDHRAARRDRLGDHRVLPRGDGQRGLVRHRGHLHLRHRLPVLRPADRDEDRPPARRQRHARRTFRERHRLHADRPAGAVRPPLRGDRRRGPAGRPGAGHADGLSAGHHLDHHRRGVRRLCAGLPGAVDLHPAARPLSRPDGPRRTRRDRRRRRHRRRARHHGDPARGAGPGGGRRAGREPVGRLLDRDDHPDRHLHGPVPAVPAARPGVRGVADRRRPAAARRDLRRLGRRNRLGHRLVHTVQGDAVVVHHHLRLRRVGAAGVAAAGPARLPVDVHEGRHHRAAGARHPAGPPDHGGARHLPVRQQAARARSSPARCSRSCSSPSPAARCRASTR